MPSPDLNEMRDVRKNILGKELVSQIEKNYENHAKLKEKYLNFKPAVFSEEVQKKREDSATKIQRFFRKHFGENSLVTINSRGKHTPEFIHFLLNNVLTRDKNNGKIDFKDQKDIKIKRSSDIKAIRKFSEILNSENCTYDDPIFSNENAVFLALAALDRGEITYAKCETFLSRAQFILDHPEEKIISFHLPSIKEFEHRYNILHSFSNSLRVPLGKKNICQILEEINELPVSEQFIFMVESCTVANAGNNIIASSGIHRLIFLHNPHKISNATYVYSIGVFNLYDIERGQEFNIRPASIGYPTAKNPRRAHEIFKGTDLVRQHDLIHCLSNQTVSPQMRAAVEYTKKVIRACQAHYWSKELWLLTDILPQYLFLKYSENFTALYFLCMRTIGDMDARESQPFFAFAIYGLPASDLAFLIILDLIENAKKWQEFSITKDDLAESKLKKFNLFIGSEADENMEYLRKVRSNLTIADKMFPEIKNLPKTEQVARLMSNILEENKCSIPQDKKTNNLRFFKKPDNNISLCLLEGPLLRP